MVDKKLLEQRNRIKKKKPEFSKQDSHKKPKLGDRWRKPRGLQSKMRLGKKGYRTCVSKGYKSPTKIKGLNREGFEEIIVSNISQLKTIDTKTQIAVIGAKVGIKKRVEIAKEAEKLKISIGNMKDIPGFIKKIEDNMKKKKEKKKEVEEKKEKTKKENEKKEEKTKEETIDKIAESESEKTTEELAKEEKKERDRFLARNE